MSWRGSTDLEDQPAALARRVKAIEEALLLDMLWESRAIGREAREINGGGDGVKAFSGADHGLVDSFGAPDKVGAVFEGEEAGGEFAGADHWGKNDFVAIVDAIFGNGNSFKRGGHDGMTAAEEVAEHMILMACSIKYRAVKKPKVR